MQTKFISDEAAISFASPSGGAGERIAKAVTWAFYAGAVVLPILATAAAMAVRMELLLATATVVYAVAVRNMGGWTTLASRRGAMAAAGVAAAASLTIRSPVIDADPRSAAAALTVLVTAIACAAGVLRRLQVSARLSGWLLAGTMSAAALWVRFPTPGSSGMLGVFGLLSAACMWIIAQRKPTPWLTPAGIVEQTLSRMPTQRRHVLLNTYVHQMNRQQVAAALGATEARVGIELRRGRSEIARALDSRKFTSWLVARRDETLISDFLDDEAEAEPVVQRLLHNAKFKQTANAMFNAHELLQGYRLDMDADVVVKRGFRAFLRMLRWTLGVLAAVAVVWLAGDAALRGRETRAARAEGRAVSSDLWLRATAWTDPGQTTTVLSWSGPRTLYENSRVTTGYRFGAADWRRSRSTLDGRMQVTIDTRFPWLVNTATAELMLNRGSYVVTSVPGTGVTTIVVRSGTAGVRHIGDTGAFVNVTGGQEAVVTDAVRVTVAK